MTAPTDPTGEPGDTRWGRAARAMMPARGGGDGITDGGAPLTEHGWRASVIGLHLAMGVVLGLALVTVLLESPPGNRSWLALGALAVLGAAYLIRGARAISGDDPNGALIYLSVLIVITGVVAWTAPGALFLLFLAYPQIWFLVESSKPGVIWTCLLAASSGIGLTVAAVQQDVTPWSAVTSSGIGLVFSVLMGTWIARVLAQSRQRAELIAELEASRAEVARLHHDQGVAQERERMAREIHDTLAQGYTSIVMLAQTALGQIDDRPDVARERIELVEEVARENLAEARRVVAAFTPPSLDGSTLIEALAGLAARFERETGIAVTADLPPAAVVDRDREVVLLRAAQEALTNVRRHAAATTVKLSLTDGQDVSLAVTDDGVGFDATTAGTGLAGLRSRVVQGDGTVQVHSRPGAGTTVIVTVPAAQPTSTPCR
ncbi:MAG: sensor histidine kinase [Nakamurella sp.]